MEAGMLERWWRFCGPWNVRSGQDNRWTPERLWPNWWAPDNCVPSYFNPNLQPPLHLWFRMGPYSLANAVSDTVAKFLFLTQIHMNATIRLL